jgi:hypothetical protein
LRLIVGIFVAGLSYSRWATYSPPTNAKILAYLYSPTGNTISRASTSIPLSIFLPLLAVTTLAVIKRFHTSESLLVIRGLGIQTSTSGSTYLNTATTRFIPTEKVRDLWVNEAFRGFEVRYYLGVVVEGEDELVVVFPVSLKLVSICIRTLTKLCTEIATQATHRREGLERSKRVLI